jgi:predicted dehydrogenase
MRWSHRDEVPIPGVCSRSPEPIREIAERYGVPYFDRFSELLDRCDAVAFAVPPATQAELAADAARRGKAVFLERPLAGDIAGGEQLAAAVRTHHVISQMGLSWRYGARVGGS